MKRIAAPDDATPADTMMFAMLILASLNPIVLCFSILSPYLNLSVAKPSRTHNMVIIQKRTTTCVSFQPFNS
jgi:hypothetical protein